MADHGPQNIDRGTYERTLGMLKWGAVGSVLIAFLVMYLLAG